MSSLGPKSPRARAIFDYLYGNQLYPYVKPAYDSNELGFRERVDNYLYPDGINLALSVPLGELRKEIESYSGVPADYAAKKAAIVGKFAALAPTDKAEINRNRAWRDLVEDKFRGTVVISVAPLVTEPEKDQIKKELNIPM